MITVRRQFPYLIVIIQSSEGAMSGIRTMAGGFTQLREFWARYLAKNAMQVAAGESGENKGKTGES